MESRPARAGRRFWRSRRLSAELIQRHRLHGFPLSRQNAPVIIHLAEVVGEMRSEMSEERAGGGVDAAHRLGIWPSEGGLAYLAHPALDPGDPYIHLPHHPAPPHLPRTT